MRMITSRDLILTTHVGGLPRNKTLSDLLVRREAGEAIDAAVMDAEMDKSVRYVVARQMDRRGFQTPTRTGVRGIPATGRNAEAAHPAGQQTAEPAGMRREMPTTSAGNSLLFVVIQVDTESAAHRTGGKTQCFEKPQWLSCWLPPALALSRL